METGSHHERSSSSAPQKLCEEMDPPEFSLLSSMRGEFKSELYVQPHYKEAYRLAIDRLVEEGRDAYHDVLKAERIGNILSDDEIFFITTNAEQLVAQPSTEEEENCPVDKQSSSGTYWPVKSDVEAPNLELGWPDFLDENVQTKIDLLFHPPRPNNPTIKEVIRKHIQNARQVIAIVMDAFTDVDIFKEAIDASIHGVAVYVLLDHSHLKSFLSMAESLDIKIQQLRHMRVRTVKGQDYLCRSGAKFHGALEQKFLLVDCHIAIYGSYSYTWSFEKINQSMVQVIKGHLVKSYDEEFRVLYAKSTVPTELTPLEGWSQQNDFIGQPILSKLIGRHDQLRHSLDTAYQRTNERTFMRDLEDRAFEKENNIMNGITIHGQKPQFPYLDSVKSTSYNKRHSYAGERGDGYLSPNLKLRGSNWNVSREEKNSQINHSMNNYLQVPQHFRGQNMQQVPFMQQNKSPMQTVSKSLMQTWRIEAYLNNSDTTFAEPCDYSDQFGALDKGGSFMQERMRNSLALGPTILEQRELSRFTNNASRGVGHLATPKSHLHISSMQWNSEEAEKRVNSDDFMTKQQSQQIMDDFSHNSGFGQGNNSYASLGRTHRMITSPDYLTDNWYKRHSVADPRSNTEPTYDSPGEMYGAFQRTSVNRSTAGINTQNGGCRSSLKEDQRSVSHYDVKSVAKSPKSQIWKEPLSRTKSAAALEHESKSSTDKPNNASSPEKKRPWKIKSLLNIPEKKEEPVHNTKTPSVISGDSTDTLTAEEEERISCRGKNLHQTATSSVKDSESHMDSREDDNPKLSKPRFVTEEYQSPSQRSFHKTTAAKKISAPDRSWRPGSENRLYSRFEPFCSLEKKNSLPNSQGKSKSFPKVDVELSTVRATKGHHENKLEKLFHRMGSLLHKNK
ncbi:protein FAM83B isoform X2 [Oryzias melastigma]|uniref:protein FAM83B isoform X2 n=1 Tax=Oryzias melastigma TaxID=30732 RepID=UPI000CF82DC9|nr:protein FAM83B isoform X2 [Oryzias melastigma]